MHKHRPYSGTRAHLEKVNQESMEQLFERGPANKKEKDRLAKWLHKLRPVGIPKNWKRTKPYR